MRRPFKTDAPVKDGPRSNREIRIPKVQLINEEGENLGVIATDQALRMAEEAGLDLVEISPNAEPPVCKILDLGKLKYANQKKAAEARKKQKIVEVKEIKMRPNID
ncbi:MAG: translation initiation factor IF-3, partial [Allorhizobium sp.]